MADVFLSYAREDRAKAEQIATALASGGYNVFWDVEIPPGTSWADFLAEKLSASRAAIVLWSKTSTASQWVREEARLARDKGKLIPVMIDDSVPPFGFGEIQAANLSSWNGEADNAQWKLLLEGISRAVGSAPTGRAEAPPIRPATGGWNAPPTGDQPKKGPGPFAIIGGGVVALVVLVGVIGALSGGGGTSNSGVSTGGLAPAPISAPGAIGGATLPPGVQGIVADAQAAANSGADAMKLASDYAGKGQAAAAQAQTGAGGFGTSQGPMGMIAGDLMGLQSGREAPVGIAMVQGTQFYGVLQVLNAQGNSYVMNGNALVTGGGAASGKWTYSGGQFEFVGGGSIPNKYTLQTRETGPADGSGTRGIGRVSYPNGEVYLGEYRAVGEGVQAQVFRNGLGAHYDAKGGVINAGRFDNDSYVGPS